MMPGNRLYRTYQSPTRTSPRKSNSTKQTTKPQLYPTPLSMSPSPSTTTTTNLRYPPSFDTGFASTSASASAPAGRFNAGTGTRGYGYSPYQGSYRPGDYGRSERGTGLSERSGSVSVSGGAVGAGVERRLFEDEEEQRDDGHEKESGLQPAFEAKMVLRNGASVDLISWLRTNFHYIPPPHHTTPMPLNGIRHLLLERFPRAPDLSEIYKAVLAAFPKSSWDGVADVAGDGVDGEPPMIRGLVWHGQDVDEQWENTQSSLSAQTQAVPQNHKTHQYNRLSNGSSTTHLNTNSNTTKTSRSPPQSTLVSPISTCTKRILPDTPARSVLDEFAEIATLADKTPGGGTRSLSLSDSTVSGQAQGQGELEFGRAEGLLLEVADGERGRKRKSSGSPQPLESSLSREYPQNLGRHRRRASTPDKLHGLLAAAEAVEGSPITSVLGHKRRRTIGGTGSAREIVRGPSATTGGGGGGGARNRKGRSRMTMSPPLTTSMGMSIPPGRGYGGLGMEYAVPLNDTVGVSRVAEEDSASLGESPLGYPSGSRTSFSAPAHPPNPASSSSSTPGPSTASASRTARKPNELPTEGLHPGYDCKPPFPYHEMIRHAIEASPDGRLQLNQIYSSIAERFPFFKTLDDKKTAGWQNSIRHNLSLKKMFVRVNKPEPPSSMPSPSGSTSAGAYPPHSASSLTASASTSSISALTDDSAGKGGWWTVVPGIPDEGRPGRKAKARKMKEAKEKEAKGGKGGKGKSEVGNVVAAVVPAEAQVHGGLERLEEEHGNTAASASASANPNPNPNPNDQALLEKYPENVEAPFGGLWKREI